jgi:hypothetical protein
MNFITDLGNKPRESVLNQAGDTAEQVAKQTHFSNLQSTAYWSATELAPTPNHAWYFGVSSGLQSYLSESVPLYALAARSGDVAASVPEPQTLALAHFSLTAAAAARRRRFVTGIAAASARTHVEHAAGHPNH